MSRPLTVLYAGPGLAGRMTTLLRLAPRTVDEPGELVWDRQGYTQRLGRGVDIELDGRTRRVRIVTFHVGSLSVRPRAALGLPEGAPIRRSAETFLGLLPDVDGAVFVASSWEFSRDANVEKLEQTLEELADEDVDVARLPVVFQLNWRDRFDALPVSTLEADLHTARCAHVESIASAGAGVREALATLARMIDRPTDTTRGPTAARLAIGRDETTLDAAIPSPIEIESLFRPCVEPLFRDGSCRQRFTARVAGTLVSTTGAFHFGQRHLAPAVRAEIPTGPHGIQVAARDLEFDDHGGVASAGTSPLAARLELGGTTARFEPVRLTTVRTYPVVVFGEEVSSRALRRLEGHAAARDAWVLFRRSGFAVLKSLDGETPGLSILGIRVPTPWNVGEHLGFGEEGATAMFDTLAWDEPIRAFWGYGGDGALTSFVVLGQPGWQTILRRRVA